MAHNGTAIDEYLATVRDDQRSALEALRATIREAAPNAEECISYQLPAFRQKRMLVGFGATARHCAFYLWSSSTVDAFSELLRDYDTSAGTIRFQPNNPLPPDLVRLLVTARLQENAAKDRKKNN